MAKKAQAIFRIVNNAGLDDVDMTRAEALIVLRQLQQALHPRRSALVKRRKR